MIEQIIFTESTLSHSEAFKFVSEKTLLLSSIKRGDLINAVNNHKHLKRIVIIDGVFEQCPSITHKEIMWAIDKEVYVVGVSSLGALRAVELRDYGMIGSGEIYDSYLTGNIDGDDEVAVCFIRNKNKLYKTIPLVNLRKTIKNTFDDSFSEGIINTLKNIHYRDRTWEEIKLSIDFDSYTMIRENYIDLKKKDAITYLLKSNKSFNAINYMVNCEVANIYFKTLYNKHIYNDEFDMIKKGIINYHGSVSSCLHQNDQVIIGVLKILDVDKKYYCALSFVLMRLSYFEYKNNTVLLFLSKFIKKQKMKNKLELMGFLNNIEVKKELVVPIFNSLLKLSKFFNFRTAQ